MAELAFGLAQTVLVKLASKGYEEISLAKSAKEDLKKLGETVLTLKSVLKDAEKKQKQNEELRRWLVRLKDLLNDAVDVLDEFECEALRRQVVKDYGSFGRKVRRFFSSSNPLAFRISIAHRVKEVRERFAGITDEMARFGLIRAELDVREEHHHLSDTEMKKRMTHSFITDSEVIGRDADKAAIIDMLIRQDGRGEDGHNLSVIPIVGLGGLGKTTLAKSVFNDEKVRGMFDLKLWVCVSLDFDVPRLLREILKSATNAEQDLGSLSLDQLQTSVRTSLEGRKYLLILDDVWNENRNDWVELRKFLIGGGEGSKVIVTTRSTKVSSIMTDTPPHQLEGLSEDDSLALFFKSAFGDEKQVSRYPKLEDIGKEIVKKCGGLPLALKALGSLLYSRRTEEEWKTIRDNEIWQLEQEDDVILPALQLSYNTMSSCTKQCFAYCSTYPDDAEMSSLELIPIWMALGMLQSHNDKMELEDFGHLQFRELCARSFLLYDGGDDDEEETCYGLFYDCNMHDLIHDLARSIAKSECSIVNSERDDVSDGVRYLRLSCTQNSLSVLQRLKKLRSIHLTETARENSIGKSSLSLCIKKFRYLRVFNLSGISFDILPSSIGSLKHLRYLNLSGNQKIKRLPKSICKLQTLQTLLLLGCEELQELPRDLRYLVSLRTLGITTKHESLPENGIGRLKSLRTLIISDCENLKSLPRDLSYSTTLCTLIIGDCEELNLASEVDELGTQQLSIQSFVIDELPETTTLPQWLRGASHTLKLLAIENCDNLVALPEWLPDCASLEKLVIKNCEEISTLPNGIHRLHSLTDLKIEDCEKLDLASGHDEFFQMKLQKLKISALPNTTALPQWLRGAMHSLELLEIGKCPLASLPEWLPNFVSLQKLVVKRCDELLGLPKGMQRLTSLTDMQIVDCKQLELASESNEVVSLSLQNLMIEGLPQTTSLPQWIKGASHTLQCLFISRCPELVALPEWLPDLTSLKKLDIRLCPRLSALPEGMSRLVSLTHLEIKRCHPEFHRRYEPKIGEDWKNIAHVPDVCITNSEDGY